MNLFMRISEQIKCKTQPWCWSRYTKTTWTKDGKKEKMRNNYIFSINFFVIYFFISKKQNTQKKQFPRDTYKIYIILWLNFFRRPIQESDANQRKMEETKIKMPFSSFVFLTLLSRTRWRYNLFCFIQSAIRLINVYFVTIRYYINVADSDSDISILI